MSATTETRDVNGRFAPGNPSKPGNPFARQVAALRQAFVNSITPEDIQMLGKALLRFAIQGNMQAAKLLLTYVLGKPTAVPEPDRMDADEWQGYQETASMEKESAAVIKGGLPETHLKVARTMKPIIAELMLQQITEVMNETPEQREAKEAAAAAECERMLNSVGPEWCEKLDKLLNGEKKASPTSFNGEAPPSANGRFRMPEPSANGHG